MNPMHEDNKENQAVNGLGEQISWQVAGDLFDSLAFPIEMPRRPKRRGGQQHTRAQAPSVLGSHACSGPCNAGSGHCNAGTAGSADGERLLVFSGWDRGDAVMEAQAGAEAEVEVEAEVEGEVEVETEAVAEVEAVVETVVVVR